MPLSRLDEADDVAVCVLHGGDQLASADILDLLLRFRARRRVRGAGTVPDADLTSQREVVEAFLAAAREGDFDALVAVLQGCSGPGLARRYRRKALI